MMLYAYELDATLHGREASRGARQMLCSSSVPVPPAYSTSDYHSEQYYLGYFGGVPAYDPDDVEKDDHQRLYSTYTDTSTSAAMYLDDHDTISSDNVTSGSSISRTSGGTSCSDGSSSLTEDEAPGLVGLDYATAMAARAATAAVQAVRGGISGVGVGGAASGGGAGGGSGYNNKNVSPSLTRTTGTPTNPLSPSTISDVVKLAMEQMAPKNRNESTRHYVKEYVTHLMEGGENNNIAVRHREIPPELSSADEMRLAIRLGNFSKTAMCRYNKQGKCTRNSETCRFAHHISELRIRPILDKTSWCQEYKKNMTCSQGMDCKFAHSADELRATENLAKTKACSFFARGTCLNGEFCRFSHGDL